jgi:outer membrane receptor protein involved in Fe transport
LIVPKQISKKILFFLIIFLFIIDYQNAISQSDTIDPYQLSLEQLSKVVITASKTPQLITKITQKVDVITEQQISNIIQNNRNIAELMQYLPGASVKVLSRNDVNWGAYGGIGTKYNTFMVDGLSIDGYTDPMNIDIMAIRRIEIQRGPASVLYPNYLSQDFAGNQCALAGTVNLILKEDIKQANTILGLDYGSYNTITARAYHENRYGRLNIMLGATYEKSDYTNYGSPNSWLSMLKNPVYDKEKIFLNASMFLDNKEKHKISLFGNQTFHKGDVGRINRKYDNNYSIMNLSYLGQFSNALKITAKAGIRSSNRLWQEDNYSIDSSQSLRETDGVNQIIIPADISLSFNHFNNSILTFGVDYQQAFYSTWLEPVNVAKEISNDAKATQTGVYLQEELQFNKFTFRGGLRMNKIGYSIAKLNGQIPGANKQSWIVGLWSAGIKYRLNDDWTIFTNGGNSFMSPSLKSIGGTIPITDKFVPGKSGQLPNPDLKPESGMSFDIGVDARIITSLDLSLRVFYSKIIDAIIENIVSQDPSQTMSINADGATKIQGIEIGLKQLINKKIEWFANTTYIKSKIYDPNNPDQNGVEVPFVPSFTGNLGLTFKFPLDIQVIPSVHYGGRIFDSSSKKDRNSYDSRELLNLIIIKAFNISEMNRLDISLKLYNLTNNKYDMPWGFRDPGFNFTIGVSINF